LNAWDRGELRQNWHAPPNVSQRHTQSSPASSLQRRAAGRHAEPDHTKESTMTTITVLQPATVRVPRAAPIAAEIALRLLGAVEQFVNGYRAHRAANKRIAEAAAVRRFADQVRELDPRFASDLYAAADRHELT
jgi:hypothetical protein